MVQNQTGDRLGSRISRRLEGKVAIITGSSRGIGAAAARYFAQAGAVVVLAARDVQALEYIARDITANDGQALAVSTDVTDPESVERLVKQTLDTFGHLDAAFNNAGDSHPPIPLADISIDEFERIVRVNLMGTFLAMKYEIPAMIASGGGTIVNMASTAGLQGARGIGDYTAAKHGIVGLTKAAALDYGQQHIRVNVVAPGPILNDRIAALSDEAREPINRAVPMHRIGQPDEVAAVAAWLCSEDSSFVTGTVVSVDGGRMAGYKG